MAHSSYFCSLASQANRETLYGTVARIRSWLLIEYPYVWRRDAIEDSSLLPDPVKAHIRQIGVDRSLLIRQVHQPRYPIRTFLVDSCENPPSIRQQDWEDYGQLTSLSREAPGKAVSGLMFLVCTHSRHDKCCAKFGIPVWCALRDYLPEQAWQCSHVGGDRFAGNVVVMPHGLFYGRVTPADVPELVRRSDAGEIWLPGYRGRSCYGRIAQVAEYFLRSESGELGIDAFRLASVSDGAVVFEEVADGAEHRVEFITRPGAFRQRLTCHAEDESPVSQYELTSYIRRPR